MCDSLVGGMARMGSSVERRGHEVHEAGFTLLVPEEVATAPAAEMPLEAGRGPDLLQAFLTIES
jgi:hypothetical protein